MHVRKVFAAVVATPALAAGALAATPEAEEPYAIRIVDVRALDVPGPLQDTFARVYQVRVRISGWRMYPLYEHENRSDGGHWRLYVDGLHVSTSNDGIAHTPALTPGSHRLWAELRDNDDTPLFKRAAWSEEVVVEVD